MLGNVSADNLFVYAYQQQQTLESLSNNALSAGLDLYRKGDYQSATGAFQRAIDLAPQSALASHACNYLSMAWIKLNKPDKAIAAYQKWIQLNPGQSDPHLKLGNLYFSQKKYQEALEEFSEAVRLDPNAKNRYSLGQCYLFLNRFGEAETEFRAVQRLAPDDPAGYYGTGLAYSKQGRHEHAIDMFDQAIRLDREFYDAYAEKGYALSDMGEMEEAQKVFEFLEQKDPDLADMLSRYMYKVDPPKIVLASAVESTFPYQRPRNALVSNLDSYLENANAEKTFTVVFRFDKKMDRSSVEDRFNWTIKRSLMDGAGTAYNLGLSIPDTEVAVPCFPTCVYYDEKSLSATVYFTVRQNASANGTIDPSHIEFQFRGQDQWGLSMSREADQFTGFSGVF